MQQVFVNAYRAMAGDDERELQVRPWLYRIARNQCLSMLRARRPTEELGAEEPSLVGLSDEVAGRADLRAMLRDLAALPTDQREALVLAELHDNSHAQVAEILGCDHNKVKSLVFQARTSLMTSRQARELRCEEVQSQLSVLRGGSLRRAVLRRHLAECDACRLFGAEVKRQRAALAVVLPVVPTGGLKLGAATALAAGTGAAASTGTATTAGAGAGIAAKLGVPATLLKSAAATLAVTTAAAGGVATTAQVAHVTGKPPAPITQQAEQSRPAAPGAPGDAAAAQPPPVCSRRCGPAARGSSCGQAQRPAAAGWAVPARRAQAQWRVPAPPGGTEKAATHRTGAPDPRQAARTPRARAQAGRAPGPACALARTHKRADPAHRADSPRGRRLPGTSLASCGFGAASARVQRPERRLPPRIGAFFLYT